MIFLSVLSVLLYLTNKRIWAPHKNKIEALGPVLGYQKGPPLIGGPFAFQDAEVGRAVPAAGLRKGRQCGAAVVRRRRPPARPDRQSRGRPADRGSRRSPSRPCPTSRSRTSVSISCRSDGPKGGEGLVQQHDRPVRQQGARQRGTALLAAGQCARLALPHPLQPDRRQRSVDLSCCCAASAAGAVQGPADVLRDRQMGKQVVILKQHGDRPVAGHARGDVIAVPQDAPGAGRQEPRNRRQQRRFAAARRPDDGGQRPAGSPDRRVRRKSPSARVTPSSVSIHAPSPVEDPEGAKRQRQQQQGRPGRRVHAVGAHQAIHRKRQRCLRVGRRTER